jgi:hypothetical protein
MSWTIFCVINEINITVSVLVTSMSFLPVVEESESLIAYTDSVTTLQCVTSASRPAATVTWKCPHLNITAIDSSSSSEGSGGSQTYIVTSILAFTATYPDNNRIISCTASNDPGLSEVKRDIRLDVQGRLVSNQVMSMGYLWWSPIIRPRLDVQGGASNVRCPSVNILFHCLYWVSDTTGTGSSGCIYFALEYCTVCWIFRKVSKLQIVCPYILIHFKFRH